MRRIFVSEPCDPYAESEKLASKVTGHLFSALYLSMGLAAVAAIVVAAFFGKLPEYLLIMFVVQILIWGVVIAVALGIRNWLLYYRLMRVGV